MIPPYIRIIIWLILIAIGASTGFCIGRWAVPYCELGVTGTTATQSTTYTVDYDDDGKVRQKSKTVMKNPKIRKTREKYVAPTLGINLTTDITKRSQFNLGVEYKLFNNVLDSGASLYIMGGPTYDRESDKFGGHVGLSIKFGKESE